MLTVVKSCTVTIYVSTLVRTRSELYKPAAVMYGVHLICLWKPNLSRWDEFEDFWLSDCNLQCSAIMWAWGKAWAFSVCVSYVRIHICELESLCALLKISSPSSQPLPISVGVGFQSSHATQYQCFVRSDCLSKLLSLVTWSSCKLSVTTVNDVWIALFRDLIPVYNI